jgi:predicted ribosome quality control (RQC) complex YloA/Tae2 family protein
MRTHLIQVTPDLEVSYDVGQSAQENHDMIDAAEPTDLWFHVTGRPSCHVIAHVPDEVLESPSKPRRAALRKIMTQGAVLCKRFSKYASEKRLSMDVARVADLEKTDIPGTVIVGGESQTVII